jgi:hypothetical protein
MHNVLQQSWNAPLFDPKNKPDFWLILITFSLNPKRVVSLSLLALMESIAN